MVEFGLAKPSKMKRIIKPNTANLVFVWSLNFAEEREKKPFNESNSKDLTKWKLETPSDEFFYFLQVKCTHIET